MEQVLIIDDEPGIIEMLVRSLKLAGVPATGALSGAEGLRLMEAGLFNIVLCDIRLPDVDGKELIGKLREINPLCQVVMITAYSSMENIVMCLGGGAVDYLTKPFKGDELVTVIRQLDQKLARWKKQTPLVSG